VSKNNTGSLPLRGILPVIRSQLMIYLVRDVYTQELYLSRIMHLTN